MLRSGTPSILRKRRATAMKVRQLQPVVKGDPGQDAGARRFYSLRVHEIRRLTRESVAVTFDVPDEFRDRFAFAAGQHLTVRAVIGGVEQRRCYSICSAVQDARLRIAVKRAPGGLFSGWVNDHLRAGDYLEVMPPSGTFGVSLAPDRCNGYVAFAAGSGITPIISILKTALFVERRSRFTLFFANRSSDSVMFLDELLDLKDQYLERFTLVHVLSRERQELELLHGRIDRLKCGALLDRWVPQAAIDLAFLCGPEGMMREVKIALGERGIDESRVSVERFWRAPGKLAPSRGMEGTASSVPAPTKRRPPLPAATDCEVRMIIDGIEHSFTMKKTEEPLLHAGLRHGIDLRYGCRGGVCGTCRAHLREGQVRMDTNYALENHELARGFILTCQSYPLTERVVVDYDRYY
jgi:ring-1,2-phenylacetyl-CoA epoxidase subunit PaaE